MFKSNGSCVRYQSQHLCNTQHNRYHKEVAALLWTTDFSIQTQAKKYCSYDVEVQISKPPLATFHPTLHGIDIVPLPFFFHIRAYIMSQFFHRQFLATWQMCQLLLPYGSSLSIQTATNI